MDESIKNKLLLAFVAASFSLFGWLGYEVVNLKSDGNLAEATLQLTRIIGTVNAKLDTEIERSKIKDDRTTKWLKHTSDSTIDLRDRVIRLEVKEGVNHGD